MLIDVRSRVPEGGFLHGWLQYAAPFQSPDSYFLYSLLAVASAAVNARLLVNPGSEPEVFTNVYILLLGPSGARKGTAIRHATRLLGDAVPECPVLPNAFSMEKLHSRLARESGEKGKCGGLVVAHEFQRLVGGTDYQLANFGFLTEIWDVPARYTRDTHAHDEEPLLQPYVTGLWSVTPDGIGKIDPSVLDAGGLRRILIVQEYRRKHSVARLIRDSVLFNRLVEVVRTRLGPGAFGPTKMVLSEQAEEQRERWNHAVIAKLEAKAGEREAHFISCMEAHSFKLGALVAVLETGKPDILEVGALRIGQDLVQALLPNMFQAYSALVPTPFARLKASMLRIILSHGGTMNVSAFDRAVSRSMGVRPTEIMEARQSLIVDGLVVTDGTTMKVR